MTYSERIRELREDKDYSQERVARQLGIAQRTYADYESNRIKLSTDHLITLAKFYNVDLNYIAGVSNIRNSFPQK